MKCSVLTAKDSPFEIRDCEDLPLDANEVRIALKASALNHRDLWIQKGLYAGIEYPLTTGSDGAGVVEALGEDVNTFQPGDEVIINPAFFWGDNEAVQSGDFEILGLPLKGTHATHVVVPADRVHTKPAHLSWEEAAALPLAGLTAYRALFSRAKAGVGDKVLVTGVGGGVALFALQFAAAAGLEVYVSTSSDAKADAAKAMGASGSFNYKEEEWVKKAQELTGGVDVIIDGAGGDGLSDLIELCNPAGRIAIYGATTGLPSTLDLRKLFWKQLSVLGTTMGSDKDFSEMLAFVSEQRLCPVVDKSFPLNEINEAFGYLEAGLQFGKIILLQ